MKIAAKLAGAVVGGLLLLPTAALATANPPQPPAAEQHRFAAPDQAGIAGGLQLLGQEEDNPRLPLKKRKKPQFQTRFFAE